MIEIEKIQDTDIRQIIEVEGKMKLIYSASSLTTFILAKDSKKK